LDPRFFGWMVFIIRQSVFAFFLCPAEFFAELVSDDAFYRKLTDISRKRPPPPPHTTLYWSSRRTARRRHERIESRGVANCCGEFEGGPDPSLLFEGSEGLVCDVPCGRNPSSAPAYASNSSSSRQCADGARFMANRFSPCNFYSFSFYPSQFDFWNLQAGGHRFDPGHGHQPSACNFQK